MGIVLSVLEPPHQPDQNLLAALPDETGHVIDVEPRLVSPRFDTLLVTSRGLVVRDHVTGDFHGMPWAHFSIDDHLRHHSRHAVLTMWIGDRRPVELAVTRRLALNIVSVAPVLQLHPGIEVDEVVVAESSLGVGPDAAVDLRDRQPEPVAVPVGVGAQPDGYASSSGASPPPPPATADWHQPPPPPLDEPVILPLSRPDSSLPPLTNHHALHNVHARAMAAARRKRLIQMSGIAAVLVAAGLVGTVASMVAGGGDDGSAEPVPMLTSEAADFD